MRSLDKCQSCNVGFMVTYRTRRFKTRPGGRRYLKCDHCGITGLEIVTEIRTRQNVGTISGNVVPRKQPAAVTMESAATR